MNKAILAYHFTDGWQLRDGQPLVVGSEYVFDGEPVMCECGYHASRHVFDALKYAPGSILSRVECKEITDECDDKLVCRRRRVIATIDATKILRKFARLCALDVVHLWEAPDIVIRYLKTGDEALRDAARIAAWDARSAAWDTGDAARDTRDDAREAAWSAAMDAAWAAWAAARSAAWAAAWDTRDAAWNAARSAAWAAALDAARTATRDATRRRQRRRLARMVNQAFKQTGGEQR